MSTDMEDLLRTTLVQQSRDVATPPDPWTRFEGREKMHRRNRRVAAGSALSAVLLVGALVQTGTIALPDRETNATVKFASSSPLFKAPVRGSLASDEKWLDGLLESIDSVQVMLVPSSLPSEPPPTPTAPPTAGEDGVTTSGPITVPDASMPGTVTLEVTPEDMRVLYAGDVSPERRLAAVAVGGEHKGRDVAAIVWVEGPAGAAPGEMKQSHETTIESQGRQDTVSMSPMHGPKGQPRKVDEVVILTVPGVQVEVAGRVHYLAEGRVEHPWTTLPNRDGVVLVDARRGADGELVKMVRIIEDDHPVMSFSLNDSDQPDDQKQDEREIAQIVEGATVNTRGGPVDKKLLEHFLWMALHEAQLESWAGITATVPWYGTVQGQDTALITLQPHGGGVLAFAIRGKAEGSGWSGGALMRLLLPAEGADRRPLAWRVPGSEFDDTIDQSKVKVVAPAGAASAALITGGKSTEVPLKADGSGDAKVPADAEAVVRAFDANGSPMGEIPVRAVNWEMGGAFGELPGETEKTRVVP